MPKGVIRNFVAGCPSRSLMYCNFSIYVTCDGVAGKRVPHGFRLNLFLVKDRPTPL